MTYEEALEVMRESSGANFLCNYSHAGCLSRTFLPIRTHRGAFGLNPEYSFFQCYNLEVIDFNGSPYVGTANNTFRTCPKLRIIQNGLIYPLRDTLANLPGLERVETLVRPDLDIRASSKLSYSSMAYMVEHAANTTAIVITVHPDVYAKLTGDTTNDAYNDLTDEEKTQWTALIPLAAEKNITFATV